MDAAAIRNLKIKTGIVKRMTKEKAAYLKEVEVERERVIKMKEMGKDEYDLKRQEAVVNETLSMVPDSHKRLLIAYNELKEVLESSEHLSEREEYLAAKEVLEQAQQSLESP
ncbi:tubulin-specific chaperone A [Dermacentor andersoni]|uniref:tubulin-specific chaperone A n=1 Tax=Dermacentor andersoni TaxID=34620 RepID=UPI00215539F8|nr:tubulin-specific chaperone A-like [Dermacentor andersoni]